MTKAGYKNLLYDVGTELISDPKVELRRLLFICREEISTERRTPIVDVFELFDELENSGNLGIDNLGFLKEVLEELQKHSCLAKVVAFEAKRQSAALVTRSAAGEVTQDDRVVMSGAAVEQHNGGKNWIILNGSKYILLGQFSFAWLDVSNFKY